MDNRQQRAREGEQLAAQYLVERGFEILAMNYRFGRGEIDIIALDEEYTVFVEVKARWSDRYGHPLQAVPRSKQAQIIRVARGFLHEQQVTSLPCRFDVIAIEFRRGIPEITHLKNAFTDIR